MTAIRAGIQTQLVHRESRYAVCRLVRKPSLPSTAHSHLKYLFVSGSLDQRWRIARKALRPAQKRRAAESSNSMAEEGSLAPYLQSGIVVERPFHVQPSALRALNGGEPLTLGSVLQQLSMFSGDVVHIAAGKKRATLS